MDYHDRATQAMAFSLFSPFLDKTGRVDSRLLQALGVPAEVPYTGRFGKVLDEAENTQFDFYLDDAGDRKIFFVLKLDEPEFDSCENDAEHNEKLERHYRRHLADHIDDAPWLESETFCKHYEILRHVSYLGRYAASGLIFIYPKANQKLAEAENAIKRIVSKSLAPRVAILHLEYLVARILTLTEDDAALHEHFLQFKEKYVASGGT